MAQWQYFDDPAAQDELKRLNMMRGGDPQDSSSFMNAVVNPLNPASEILHQLAPQAPFSNTASTGNSAGGFNPMALKSTTPNIPTTTGWAGSGFGGASGMAKVGFLAKYGIDPTALGLGLLSTLVGSGNNVRQSFHGSGPLTDPVSSLSNALNGDATMGAALNNLLRNGFTSHAVVPQGPAPVTIPGLPFQIGGGLGTDPALKDPSILHLGTNDDFYQPPSGSNAAARRRSPV